MTTHGPDQSARSEDACDVLVVGAGGAGLAAAVSASSEGARVTVLEKGEAPGGTTALSVGSFTAAGTHLQRRRGIVDSSEAFLEDMYAFAPIIRQRDVSPLLRILAREAAATLAWLERVGVCFCGPYPEPPHRVPRMHNVVPNSRAYVFRLSAAAQRAGVRMLLRARAQRLLLDGPGRVVGVAYTSDGAHREIFARGGVILATGDYSAAPDLRARFLSSTAAAAIPVNPNSSGDGHRIAAAVGAALRSMDVSVHQLRFPPPQGWRLIDGLASSRSFCQVTAGLLNRIPIGLLGPYVRSLLATNMGPTPRLFEEGAILVNLEGDRFCDERREAEALAKQPEASGYIVFDEEIARRFSRYPYYLSTAPGIAYAYFGDYVRARPDLVHRAKDVATLARKLGLDPAKLQDALARAPGGLRPPYVAMGPLLSMLTTTEGGIAIDGRFRVVRADGMPVPGLYAAGSSGQGGLVLPGHGTHIAWAFTSGRLAGAEAAGPGTAALAVARTDCL